MFILCSINKSHKSQQLFIAFDDLCNKLHDRIIRIE